MAKLKLFKIDSVHGFLGRGIMRALGQPDHVQQAEIFIVATSKTVARDLASRTPGVPTPHMSDHAFHLAHDPSAEKLAEAGLAAEPAIFVMAGVGHPGEPGSSGRVLQVLPDGSTVVAGKFTGFGAAKTFAREGGA